MDTVTGGADLTANAAIVSLLSVIDFPVLNLPTRLGTRWRLFQLAEKSGTSSLFESPCVLVVGARYPSPSHSLSGEIFIHQHGWGLHPPIQLGATKS